MFYVIYLFHVYDSVMVRGNLTEQGGNLTEQGGNPQSKEETRKPTEQGGNLTEQGGNPQSKEETHRAGRKPTEQGGNQRPFTRSCKVR